MMLIVALYGVADNNETSAQFEGSSAEDDEILLSPLDYRKEREKGAVRLY